MIYEYTIKKCTGRTHEEKLYDFWEIRWKNIPNLLSLAKGSREEAIKTAYNFLKTYLRSEKEIVMSQITKFRR